MIRTYTTTMVPEHPTKCKLCDGKKEIRTEIGTGEFKREVVYPCYACDGTGVVWTNKTKEEKMAFKEPTIQQCNDNEKVFDDSGREGYAVRYPQMDGHFAKSVVTFDESESSTCFDVEVWPDNESPTIMEDGDSTLSMDHCAPQQFIDFGKSVISILDSKKKNP